MKRFRETKVELKIRFSLGEYTFPLKRHTRHHKRKKMEEIVTKNWYLCSFMAPHSTLIHSNTIGIEPWNLKLQGAGTKSCTQFDGTTSFFEISELLLVFTSMDWRSQEH